MVMVSLSWKTEKRKVSALIPYDKNPRRLTEVQAQQLTKSLDLFGGSGSTLIAAEHTGRVAYLCELAPVFVDVIIKRWENATGKKAVKL